LLTGQLQVEIVEPSFLFRRQSEVVSDALLGDIMQSD
jgi:hypothetical protein